MIALVAGIFGFMIGVIFEAFVEREKRWKRNQNIRPRI
jgi:membrane associated rhomboid family serine protease